MSLSLLVEHKGNGFWGDEQGLPRRSPARAVQQFTLPKRSKGHERLTINQKIK
ncbi:MAG: hypothetical protein ACLFPE_01470 [Bacteroidales bacterium]